MKLIFSLTFLLPLVHGQPTGTCWTNMDATTGECKGVPGVGVSTIDQCLSFAGATPPPDFSGLDIDIPFFSDGTSSTCVMVPGAEAIGDCCPTDTCDDADGVCLRRYNPSQCPDAYPYFRNHYLRFNGLPEGCVSVDSLTGADGDPHVKTWGGTWFDYMGQCDIVLAHVTDFDGKGNDLDVHIRTTIRRDYSYIESAAVKIGDDVLEASSWGEYALNGVEMDNSGSPEDDLTSGGLDFAGGYKLFHTQVNKKRHTFDIVLGARENITVGTFKDLVSVHVGAGPQSSKYFGKTVGLMGSHDGTLLARDGKTVMEDMNAFAQEWQVGEEEPVLFRNAREPQYPHRCVLPSPDAAKQQRRLGETVARSAAEEACGHLGSGTKFTNCVFDVMRVGDVDIAATHAI